MNEIADQQLRAISYLRADIQAMREEIRPVADRLAIVETQYAEIIALLTALKAGQPDGPKKAEFVSKRG